MSVGFDESKPNCEPDVETLAELKMHATVTATYPTCIHAVPSVSSLPPLEREGARGRAFFLEQFVLGNSELIHEV